MRINANQVASASVDLLVKVWDLNSGALVNTFIGHTFQIYCLCILPGGILVSAGPQDSIRFWNMQTQTVTSMFPPGGVWALKYNPLIGANGALVAAGMYVNFYDAVSLTYLGLTNTARSYVDVDIHAPTGNIWLAGNNALDFMNTSMVLSGGPYAYNASTGTLNKIIILPDNATVVVGTTDGRMQLFSLSTRTWGTVYSAHNSSVNALTLTPDSLYLVSGADDSSLVFWSWSTGSLTQASQLNLPSKPRSIEFISSTYTGGKYR
jgi:WD40 repeat protein